MRSDFIDSITVNQAAFGIGLDGAQTQKLADFYDLILQNNEFLHLVGPCTPEEFAVRHILESLTLLAHLPLTAKFADIGAGAGLPSIPCLLVRNGLRGVLIESKEKKAKFLETAAEALGLAGRVEVVNRQFGEVDPADCVAVTCRALDKFTERLPRLLKWSMRRRLLLFGGNNLTDALRKQKVVFDQKLMPLSEQRFLFTVGP